MTQRRRYCLVFRQALWHWLEHGGGACLEQGAGQWHHSRVSVGASSDWPPQSRRAGRGQRGSTAAQTPACACSASGFQFSRASISRRNACRFGYRASETGSQINGFLGLHLTLFASRDTCLRGQLLKGSTGLFWIQSERQASVSSRHRDAPDLATDQDTG